jgi:glutamyl-tRNA reductase
MTEGVTALATPKVVKGMAAGAEVRGRTDWRKASVSRSVAVVRAMRKRSGDGDEGDTGTAAALLS